MEQKQASKPQDKGLKLKSVQVHQAATVQHATETNFRAEKGYELYFTPNGVFVEFKGVRFIIPLANIILAVLAD